MSYRTVKRPSRPLFGCALAAMTAFAAAGCGSPAVGAGYRAQGERIANFEHPVAIAHPIANTEVASPFVLFGDATAFKGIIDYTVTAADSGDVVAEGQTDAGSMGIFSKFMVELELDPGNYEVTVTQPDPPERVATDPPYSATVYFTVTAD